MTDRLYLPEVRQQYESLPYPPRNPADETRRLVRNLPACLLAINHHCFGGNRDLRSGFRALIAGAGTGDSIIFLAEQLRDYDGEVTYLDMSVASRHIAEERARVRGLTNIRWVTASIMELPQLGLGEFDYIECSGVLHHLESPEAGLQALNAAIKDDGAIFLMLYGKYGRRSVYDMQDLLRAYLPAGIPIPEKVRLGRQLLAALPPTNSFVRDLDAWRFEISAEGFGDTGFYDLLLHAQDRCYDVPALYALAESAGLHLLGFAWRSEAYDPANHVSDEAIKAYLGTLDLRRRQALAEQIVSDIRMHEFFLARQPERGATLRDESLALRSYGSLLRSARAIADAMTSAPGQVIDLNDQGHTLTIACNPVSKLIYAHMDGMTSIRELRERIMQTLPGVTANTVETELQSVFNQLHPRGLLYLCRAGGYGVSIPDYETLFFRRPRTN